MNDNNPESVQFHCHDVDKFKIELQELIDKYTSDSDYGLDVIVKVEWFS